MLPPMPVARFTRHLTRFFPALDAVGGEPVTGATVAEVLVDLDQRHPGLRAYLVDDTGHLRRHVNIFRNGSMLLDRRGLTDSVDDEDELLIVQALSGG